MSGFSDEHLGPDYLQAHGGNVPNLATVLHDLTARKPARGWLLTVAADVLRQDLLRQARPAVQPAARAIDPMPAADFGLAVDDFKTHTMSDRCNDKVRGALAQLLTHLAEALTIQS